MRYTFTAPDISKPTYDTLEEHSKKRFSKIARLLPKDELANYELRLTVRHSGDIFELMADLVGIQGDVVKTKNRDIRKAIDEAASMMKRSLSRQKDKKVSFRKLREGLKNIFNKR